jgi:hypothetical protein
VRLWVVVVALGLLTSCGLTGAKSPLEGQMRLPPFPDPGPQAVASLQIPHGVVVQSGDEDLSDAHEHLVEALETAGFDKWTVYAYKDGFAMVVRWEQIDQAGRPAGDRFPTRHPVRIRHAFDLDEHAQLLFNAPPGDYRLFVFTVSGNDPARSADMPIDGDDVKAGELPEEIADRSGAYRAEARVYLYARDGDEKAHALSGSPLDAAGHLVSAGIFGAGELRR